MSADESCSAAQLREMAIQGDPDVVERLFRCYRDPLSRFLRSRCGHAADAEDALMEAFVAAHQNLSGYRGDAPTLSWLFRIAANACTRLRRGARNDASRHLALEDAGGLAATDLDVESLVDARTRPLKEALLTLGSRDRAVLLLRDVEGLSTREVATLLSLSEGAVKSRLFRARKALEQALALAESRGAGRPVLPATPADAARG